MNANRTQRSIVPRRVRLTEENLNHLRTQVSNSSVSALARRTALSYLLVYNIVHGRVRSVSARNYRRLFKDEPPHRSVSRVDAAYFRTMVDLYVYLMGTVSKADLFREFRKGRGPRKIDYRIFNGQIATVDPRLVEFMEKKFSDQGLDPPALRRWIDEYRQTVPEDRVPYPAIRPALRYLEETLGVHPTALLEQIVGRYETGRLTSVPRRRYERVMSLKRRVQRLSAEGRNRELAAVKEEVYGKKPGYTPFAEVEEALTFLQRRAGVGAKRYLGRSRHIYDTGGAKRIADWRARCIEQACDRFIREHPDLPLASLPDAHRRAVLGSLQRLLVLRTTDLLHREEGLLFEKQILKPRYRPSVYLNEDADFTQMDMVSSVLGMKPKAFDLMVAMNCEIFKSIGKYTLRWYLPDLYLEEIRQKEPFDMIRTKYELLASTGKPPGPMNVCMN